MAHRAHLFSLRLAHALQEACFAETYGRARLIKDLLAGITIGVIAVPLAMALAIASGVPPQFGLYTAIVAGFLIAVLGGSRFSISGPTAAFVVILQPVAQTYGLMGLLIATVMGGCLMVAMALMRIGRFIEYIPEAVTLGFTCGIAVVIAVLQLKDFLGLPEARMPEHFVEKVGVLASSLNRTHAPSLLVALVTVFTMVLWPKLKTPIPPHLPAVLLGSGLALFLAQHELPVATIGSRFSYLQIDGTMGEGIPPDLPSFEWPWLQPGPGGGRVDLSWNLIVQLFPSALAIALLGAIESLLCAVILDGMSGKRHSANSELFGQGLGNIIAPFFGGITATAAIARSAANYRAGAESPLAGAIHAIVVLASMVLLAPILAYLPMPAMAGLLVVVAWNMSELPKSLHLIKTAPRTDILILLICFSLTVLFDMVIAITVGVLLSAVLFMNEIARLTTLTDMTSHENLAHLKVHSRWRVYKVKGPLFFAAADKIFSELSLKSVNSEGVILDLDAVPLLDAGGTAALAKLLETYKSRNTSLVLTGLQSQPQATLLRAHLVEQNAALRTMPSLIDALQEYRRHDPEQAAVSEQHPNVYP